jgi:hypothetical protein
MEKEGQRTQSWRKVDLVPADCFQGCHDDSEALEAHAKHHQIVDSLQGTVPPMNDGRWPRCDHEPSRWDD